MKANKLENLPEAIALFLKTAQGLNKSMIGDYLGEREEFPMKVMYAYVDSFNFQVGSCSTTLSQILCERTCFLF